MITIGTVSDKRFSLNGVHYVKNFLSFVSGERLCIYNAYDRHDERVRLTKFGEFELDGVIYPSASTLQEALIDVIYTRSSLGGGGTPVVNQDNIPRLKSIGTVIDAAYSTFANRINSLAPFTIGEKDIFIFSALVNTNAPAVAARSYFRQYKFILKNLGKGTYGNEIGNILVTAENIEMIFVQNPSIVYVQDEANTQTIILGEIGTTPVSEVVNGQDPALVIQNQEDGYTIFQTTVDGNPVNYLFIGEGGTYGDGETQTTEADFQLLDQVTASSSYRQNFTYDGSPFDVPSNLNVTDVQNLTSPAQYVTFYKIGSQIFITSDVENNDEFKILGTL